MSKHLPVEADLIPFEAGFLPGARWLVLAPHPDDEVFGAGATLAQAVTRGVEVRIVHVTDGAAQGDAATREASARAAASLLGVAEPEFWRFADRGIAPGCKRLHRCLREEMATWRPDTVLVTSPVELHPDHRALALGLQRVLRRWLAWGLRDRPPTWVAAYEVATALQPNLLVAADQGWPTKLRATACYADQFEFRRYDRVVEAFGTMRSLTLTGVMNAEAFHVMPARSVIRLSAAGWARWMGSSRGVAPRRGSVSQTQAMSPGGDS